MALDGGLPFLGKIPLDPTFVQTSDRGKPIVADGSENSAVHAMQEVIDYVLSSPKAP